MSKIVTQCVHGKQLIDKNHNQGSNANCVAYYQAYQNPGPQTWLLGIRENFTTESDAEQPACSTYETEFTCPTGNGAVTGVTITDAGAGYYNNPTGPGIWPLELEFSHPTGGPPPHYGGPSASTAEGDAIADSGGLAGGGAPGGIVGIKMYNAGAGYTSPPTVTIYGGTPDNRAPGRQATATASIADGMCSWKEDKCVNPLGAGVCSGIATNFNKEYTPTYFIQAVLTKGNDEITPKPPATTFPATLVKNMYVYGQGGYSSYLPKETQIKGTGTNPKTQIDYISLDDLPTKSGTISLTFSKAPQCDTHVRGAACEEAGCFWTPTNGCVNPVFAGPTSPEQKADDAWAADYAMKQRYAWPPSRGITWSGKNLVMAENQCKKCTWPSGKSGLWQTLPSGEACVDVDPKPCSSYSNTSYETCMASPGCMWQNSNKRCYKFYSPCSDSLTQEKCMALNPAAGCTWTPRSSIYSGQCTEPGECSQRGEQISQACYCGGLGGEKCPVGKYCCNNVCQTSPCECIRGEDEGQQKVSNNCMCKTDLPNDKGRLCTGGQDYCCGGMCTGGSTPAMGGICSTCPSGFDGYPVSQKCLCGPSDEPCGAGNYCCDGECTPNKC